MTQPVPATPAEVKALLIEALQTLAALPDPERRFLRQKGTGWPEALREAGEVFANAVASGRHEDMAAPRIVPGPEQISRMWAVLPWFAWIDRDTAKVFAYRADDRSWAWIGHRVWRTERTCRQWTTDAAITILRKLQDGTSAEAEILAFSQSPSREARH